jgi:hypothetical protein
MLPSPSFTSVRSHAVNEFNSLRNRASIAFLLAKLLNRKNGPRSFVGTRVTGLNARRLTGVQSIPVDKIVGTIQRSDDFDKDFRPLKKHLRDRWVNALLQLDTDGWQPIDVHKVGESYYVKDGHHRVSVAKSMGITFVDAVVWDHCSCQPPRTTCVQGDRSARKHTEVCSVNA